MVDLPPTFTAAITERRFRDAATDKELQRRGAEHNDPVARALLILAAAHELATTPNKEGARLTFGRAAQFLEQAPRDLYAALLIEHVREALEALQAGRAGPPLPLGFQP